MILSPSSLALSALGLSPSGALCNTAGEGLACAICGTAISTNDIYDVLDLPTSFTNKNSIASPGGKHICGACNTVMSAGEFQMRLATGLFCKDGFFPIMRKEHRAWAFLTPPEPPFSVTIQTAKQQHVVWRAPVTLSRNLILVRIGEQIVRLRRPMLIAAREAVLRMSEARQRAATGAKTKKSEKSAPVESVESPFVTDWKFQSSAGGVLKLWAETLINEGGVSNPDRETISLLNAGEIWALQAVLHLKPVKPAPLCIVETTTELAA